MINRRELLSSLLGLPLLNAGCGSSPGRLPEQGGFVGASDGVGHRVRDGWRPRPADDAWQKLPVVIVGGGIAGLSAARKLARAGVEFILLELEPEPGGTSRSGRSTVSAFPWGAHYLPVPFAGQTELIELLDEMEVLEGRDDNGVPIVAEQFLCRDPQERLFINGTWHEDLFPWAMASEEDRQQLARFEEAVNHWVAWRDSSGHRAFTLPVADCSRDPDVLQLDSLRMSDWLRERGLTSPLLRWWIDYACRDDYGLRVDQTSAWAGLFYFAARRDKPGAESQAFITWPEGNGRLVSHLAGVCGERLRSGWTVTEIHPVTPGPEPLIEVVAASADGQVRGWRAARVIFAAPPFLARHLIPGYGRHGPASVSQLTFGSWLVANLELSDRPAEAGFPMCWDNVLFDSPSLGYVAATHQHGRDRGPTVLTWYLPLCDDDPRAARQRLLDGSWADWADVVLADLERAHPDIRRLTVRLDLMRWGHAMVRPVPGLFQSDVLEQCRQPFGGIHFAHSALSGMALFEEAFHHGNRAADEVLASLR